MNAWCLSLLLLATGNPELNVGIVYGADHSFAIRAPEGWVLDNTSGKGQGLHAVLYPKGATWANASVVMYASAASRSLEGQRTLKEMMDADVAKTKAKAPGLRVTRQPDVGKAAVLRFEGDQYGNHEAVAYIEEQPVIVMIVISGRTKAEFDRAWPAFEALLRSYEFLTTTRSAPSR